MQLTVNEHVDIIGIIERESCSTGSPVHVVPELLI